MINLLKKKINNTILRTPGLEFLKKEQNLEIKEKYLKFWLNRCAKKRSFKPFFFDISNNSSINSKKIYFDSTENFSITSEMFNSLSYNGIIIIENALPEGERNLVFEYFNELKKSTKNYHWEKNPSTIVKQNTKLTMGSVNINNFSTLKNYSDQFTKNIYNKVVLPNVDFHYLKIGQKFEDLMRGETYLHTDRFLPHFKIFYSLNEINENDAPFQYALGSHKINSQYVNFFKNAKNFDETDADGNQLISNIFTANVKSNSIYIAFTNGLHKRTDFKKLNTERNMVFLQYVERFNKLNYLI